jgi:hypothetical protein
MSRLSRRGDVPVWLNLVALAAALAALSMWGTSGWPAWIRSPLLVLAGLSLAAAMDIAILDAKLMKVLALPLVPVLRGFTTQGRAGVHGVLLDASTAWTQLLAAEKRSQRRLRGKAGLVLEALNSSAPPETSPARALLARAVIVSRTNSVLIVGGSRSSYLAVLAVLAARVDGAGVDAITAVLPEGGENAEDDLEAARKLFDFASAAEGCRTEVVGGSLADARTRNRVAALQTRPAGVVYFDGPPGSFLRGLLSLLDQRKWLQKGTVILFNTTASPLPKGLRTWFKSSRGQAQFRSRSVVAAGGAETAFEAILNYI